MHRAVDPVSAALFAELFAAVAEEMGVALMRAAFSPNVKERRDFSCAIFLGDGTLVAQAAHIPVHLGSAPLSIAAVLDAFALVEGDEVILNDPFRGGTHLPDVTLVRPVFLGKARGGRAGPADFLVANRAHHADIGGATPGSMGIAADIYGEGFRIPPVHFRSGGRLVSDFLELFRAQVRQPDERIGDLTAQSAANHVGATRLADLAHEHGLDALRAAAAALPAATERALVAELADLPRGSFRFRDWLDDDGRGTGPLPIEVTIEPKPRGVRVDFTGSAPQVAGPMNANLAVTLSATAYAFRCLLDAEVPMNGGLLRPIELIAPLGTIVNATAPAAVAGGNVETSQRIVDVLLGALSRARPHRVPAASAGTMANVSLGGRGFTYYETIGGGSGASPRRDGASAVQTHMTNTLNTPIEMLEASYPIRVRRYAVRRGSGGGGRHRGGDGIVREIVALEELDAAVLSDRGKRGPYGLHGGRPGAGSAVFLESNGRRRRLPGKVQTRLAPGDVLIVETPGGGGNGRR